MAARAPSPGFTLVELLIAISVLSLLLALGLPSISAWLQNTQIRNAAEGTLAGLQLARAEALRRNTTVRFQLVDSLTSSCVLSLSATSWIVSLADPTGACDAAPSDTAPPQIIQKRSGADGSPNVIVSATGGAGVLFTGLGRTSGVGNITQISFTNPQNGLCASAGGPMRCLQINVSPGGDVRLCDPAVSDPADPRKC